MSSTAETNSEQQHTLKQSFSLEGIGIHTGTQARVTAHPADVDTGRVFLVNGQSIPAYADWIVDTTRCTTLGKEGTRLHTVEHLLSALHAFNVDNAILEVEGIEIPILDGSALPYAQAVEQSGIIAQGKMARTIALPQPLTLEERGSRVSAEPAPVFVVEAQVEFTHWREGKASQSFHSGNNAASFYTRSIAPARTFAFQKEVEQLLAAGLARGGSLDNALIISPPDETTIKSWMEIETEFSTPLRLPQEWCAHKLLDVIGDFALFNARPLMAVTAYKPGHGSNARFVQAALKQEQERIT